MCCCCCHVCFLRDISIPDRSFTRAATKAQDGTTELLRDPPVSGSFISGAPRPFSNPRVKVSVSSASPSSPPRVAETRKWVPYFLMRFSLICCRVGRRPSNRRLRRNSGAKGSGALRKSLFSVAKLFTFQWLNSLELGTHYKVKTRFIPTSTSHANRL